jgi:uncharacterized protein
MVNINLKLVSYIEEKILSSYSKNDSAHNIEHINYVIDRSLKFASTLNNINYDMVYAIASYHDIGHYIDSKNHEKISSEMLSSDINLRVFFTEEEIKIMSEAVYDHRASMDGEPRSIYGKIVSSADRNNTVDKCCTRTYSYGKKLDPNATDEELILRAREVLINKFGENGYADGKMYFKDESYESFLKELRDLLLSEEQFEKKYRQVNKI